MLYPSILHTRLPYNPVTHTLLTQPVHLFPNLPYARFRGAARSARRVGLSDVVELWAGCVWASARDKNVCVARFCYEAKETVDAVRPTML